VKAIMLMFDSLNRRHLPCYGNTWVHAPNFERLAERSVVFDNAYVGSMPCMPARRELHTGRYNLLHRSWGPLEPFDDSLPEILREHDIYCHLVSDHQHYWEDGGATYHQRYSSWVSVRGQEGDRWKAHVDETSASNTNLRRQDAVNRQYMLTEADQPQTQTMTEGLAFLARNHHLDNWLLQIETFDPHEPFFAQQQYRDLYPDGYQGPNLDWPEYRPVDESDEEIRRYRNNYAALVSMCDTNLGRLLDAMDVLDLWDDTLLIVNTDHGFLLGEHEWWAKCRMPFYNEVAQMPLFIWDPRAGRAGDRATSLVQTIDLAPTLLDWFGITPPERMDGRSLQRVTARDEPVREAGLYGIFGGQLNVTDGRYVYMRGPTGASNGPLFEYTLMPTHMRTLFSPEELAGAQLADPLPFTKGAPVLRIPAATSENSDIAPTVLDTLLFDLLTDPLQEHPIQDEAVEAMMIGHLITLMRANDAPVEHYERLGLTPDLLAGAAHAAGASDGRV
jgi:arylsulfatase A-like enzyme